MRIFPKYRHLVCFWLFVGVVLAAFTATLILTGAWEPTPRHITTGATIALCLDVIWFACGMAVCLFSKDYWYANNLMPRVNGWRESASARRAQGANQDVDRVSP